MVAKLNILNANNTFQENAFVKKKPPCSQNSNIFELLIRRGKNLHGDSSSFGAYGQLLARYFFLPLNRKFTSYV